MAKGHKTGGRVAGTLNKATADIKALAGKYGPAALERLVALSSTAESEAAQVAACKEILDRAYGKPTQTVAGDPEHPLITEIRETFVAARHPNR